MHEVLVGEEQHELHVYAPASPQFGQQRWGEHGLPQTQEGLYNIPMLFLYVFAVLFVVGFAESKR